MKILIETIPHSAQRYPTVGDWQWETAKENEHFSVDCALATAGHPPDEPVLRIYVSQMSDWRYEVLVGIHEAVEALLCKNIGVTEDQVDQFDLNFKGLGEPGEDPAAPYNWPHAVASMHEMQLARNFGLDWDDYEREVNAL